jgi:hypothetical protein
MDNLIRLSAYALLPEVGTRCGSSAGRDLCGGWRATRIPNGTLFHYFTLFLFFLDTCCEYFYLFPAYLEQRKVRAPLVGSRAIRFTILRLIELRKRIELLTLENRNGFERTED